MVKGAAPCLRRRIAEARPGRVGLAAAVRSQWEKRLADSRQEWFVEMAKPSKPGEKKSFWKVARPERPGQSPAPISERPTDIAQPQGSSADEVAAFLKKMKSVGPLTTGERGRLIFAMDATMSRAPTWDMALAHQADMFAAVKSVGGLDVQLVYFRGFGECRASKWVSDPDALARLMSTVSCQGGQTQIGKVLSHARSEAERHRVGAMVYVGDCVEEDIDRLATKAGELKLVGIPVFLFQEGQDRNAAMAFAEIGRITGGAHCRFDQGSAAQLRELLTAVAIYAAGGRRALAALVDGRGSEGARRILAALPPPPESRG